VAGRDREGDGVEHDDTTERPTQAGHVEQRGHRSLLSMRADLVRAGSRT
jgi:hypothetical protein